MYCDILEAAAQKVRELFGEDTVILTEDPSNQAGPYFHLRLLEFEEKTVIGKRFRRNVKLSVRYRPGETDAKNRELYSTAEILMDSMDTVTLGNGDVLPGNSKIAATRDGELDFQVNFSISVLKPQVFAAPMDEMTVDVREERKNG